MHAYIVVNINMLNLFVDSKVFACTTHFMTMNLQSLKAKAEIFLCM